MKIDDNHDGTVGNRVDPTNILIHLKTYSKQIRLDIVERVSTERLQSLNVPDVKWLFLSMVIKIA